VNLDRDDIIRLAHLARLRLSADEQERFRGDLAEVLRYVALLDEIDPKRSLTPPDDHVQQDQLREDLVEPALTIDEALANAPAVDNGQFTVPAVVRLDQRESPEEA